MKQPRASVQMAAAHAHSHAAPVGLGPAFKWAVSLNVGYIVVEVVAGLAVDSLALTSGRTALSPPGTPRA
jgi:Co/Zn/Cd efflux system component